MSLLITFFVNALNLVDINHIDQTLYSEYFRIKIHLLNYTTLLAGLRICQ